MEKKGNVPLIKPENLYANNRSNEIPIICMKWIVKGYMTFLITGDQGCGKTTALKSIVRFYPFNAAIRVNELQPEMNLRYAYPDRNIIAFAQTPNISTQEGLNFQKKTSGTVNIIGEIASSQASSWFIQTCKVASKSGAGTHHGKTVPDTISAIGDDLMKENHYTDKKAVEVMVADAIDFDIHMDREEGFRYNERITEITPIKYEEYPFPDISRLSGSKEIEMAIKFNQQEFNKRITDRKTFNSKNICEYDKEAKRYVLLDMFSEEYIARITKNISKSDKEQFYKDMDHIIALNKQL